MSISDATEDAILNLIYSATTWANYAINATTSPETNIIVALHTAPLSDSAAQNVTEFGLYQLCSAKRGTFNRVHNLERRRRFRFAGGQH